MKTKLPLFALVLGALALAAGCTFPSRGTVYDRSRVGRAMAVETGDVVSVNNVTVAGDSGIIGTGGGGLVGHAAASGIGQGTGSAIAAAGGAVVGAIAGSAVEEAARRKDAQEVTIKLSSGETVVIVQETKDTPFMVGEHVQVLQGGYGATIKHLY